MTFLVAYDGSELSRAALNRAAALATLADEDIVAVAVVPGDFEYARDRGWVEADGRRGFDPAAVEADLRAGVADIAPGATFRCEHVSEYAGAHTISHRLQTVTKDVDPSVVFIGSENAGQIVTPISSVGSQLASDLRYDVYLVRHEDAPIQSVLTDE